MRQSSNRKHNRKLRGDSLILVTVFLVALFGFAALSIDVSNVFEKQRAANVGTDAGAIAASSLLTNTPQDPGSITTEAMAVAAANGVTAAEVAASTQGVVQVGYWNGTNFAANVKNGSDLYNAVLVPAKRTVPLAFGKVVGISAMAPAVHSIAALEAVGCLTNVIPFGVTAAELAAAGATFGSTYTLNDVAVGSGKQGKIDLVGYKNPGAWDTDMLNLGCGFNCQTCVGTFPTITGNAHVARDFNAIPGSTFTMPIVDQFDLSGSKPAVIVGFVRVLLLSSSGTGNNWTAMVQFLSQPLVGPGGGSCPPPCLQTRALVQ